MRTTLLRSQPLVVRAVRRTRQPQWLGASRTNPVTSSQRSFADGKTTDQTVLPGSQSQTAVATPPPPGAPVTPLTPSSSSVIPPENVPRTPPTPQQVNASPPSPAIPSTIPPTGEAGASTSPPIPPPRPKGRFTRYLFILTTLLGVSYAGGVYYSLHDDKFHDFFTDYMPYGEEAVLFFEEREFKRRFPGKGAEHGLYPQVSGEHKVQIPGRSGVSARISEVADAAKSKSSAIPDSKPPSKDGAVASPVTSKPAEKPAAQGTSSGGASKTPSTGKSAPTPAPKPTEKKAPAPKTSEKKADAKPASLIDQIHIENAQDPVVQTITKILNDLITVINADNASGKYGSSIAKAKDDLTKLASELTEFRDVEAKKSADKIQKSEQDFKQTIEEINKRLEAQQQDQELRWREEYDSERERLAQTYQDKLSTEVEAARKVAEQRLQNELLQQDIKLKDSFAADVRKRVETERSARLSKLGELSSSVAELESLTSKWGGVVDANVKTQHLVVAVEAVRSALESTNRPKPFLHELAALKEIAHDDDVVSAAIASINPSAYQRGVPTSAQLVDRFRRVATEVRKAALLPEDAGVASHATSFVLSKVLFKKSGLAVGDDVESILTRTETLLEEGNLDDAAREMNGLTGWAKVLSKDWLGDCRKVLEVRQALDVIATEARLQSLLVE